MAQSSARLACCQEHEKTVLASALMRMLLRQCSEVEMLSIRWNALRNSPATLLCNETTQRRIRAMVTGAGGSAAVPGRRNLAADGSNAGRPRTCRDGSLGGCRAACRMSDPCQAWRFVHGRRVRAAGQKEAD